MFVLCPHCQFLVAVDPRTGAPPATCPKCGGEIGTQDAGQQANVAPPAETAPPPPMASEAWSAPTPLMPAAPEAPDALTEAIATIVVADAPTPQLSADAVIAAMATKPSRKPRQDAKPAARRKRADVPPAETTPKTTPAVETAPATPAKPAQEKTPRPPLGPRLAAWVATFKPKARPAKPKAKPEPKPEPATRAGAPSKVESPSKGEAARRKATVKPGPSLRERAAKRAADAADAAAATTPSPAAPETRAPAPIVEPAPAPTIEPSVDSAPAPIEQQVVAAPEPVIAPDVVAAPEPVVETEIVATPEPIVAQAPSALPEPAPAPPHPPRPIEPEPASASQPAAPRPRTTSNAPSFARARATAARLPLPAQWPRIATIAALSLLLAMQLVLAQRDALAADARWRPTVGALCGVLRCALPAWRQPDAFTMLSRDVRPHPRAPGTLHIDASFRNDARWSQAWPLLLVSLSDIDGRVVGTRAFTPREYLGAPPTQNTLASGQTAAVTLDVVEPAPGIVAFSFEFR
jgi:hypothetical protein